MHRVQPVKALEYRNKCGSRARGSFGVDQKVDVIRHDDKRDEVVQDADSRAMSNGFSNAFGDLGLFEPSWAQGRALDLAIGYSESASVTAGSQREGAVQAK